MAWILGPIFELLERRVEFGLRTDIEYSASEFISIILPPVEIFWNFLCDVRLLLRKHGLRKIMENEAQVDRGRETVMSSGKAFRPKTPAKGGTTTTRKHRFESFNQRISKLNIDPIRRRRRNEVQEQDLEGSASFFETSLDKWKDLNLSEDFTNFVREVEPLCNSLPKVLHYQGRIFGSLESYIKKGDALSLEPLFDLLSNFAHDLGSRFEEYYSKAITLVASVAANHTDPEAIEWSFTCLAWLFKYLSRLLVQDLRPSFQIMAPLLGREPQKIHTTQFAAEAMSFLVRKAALMYPKDETPLSLILEAIKEDISIFSASEGREAHVKLYKHGLATLLLDSMKGIERRLHSCSTYLYGCLTDLVLSENENDNAVFRDIVYGVTVALVHHTDAAGFKPVLDIVLESAQSLDADCSSRRISACGRLLFTACTVRQGSRIQDWNFALDATLKLLELCDMSDGATITEIYKVAAVTLQSSPLEIVIPRFRLAMKTIEKDELERYFLPFCNYFSDLGRERFQDLLLPYFSKFVTSKWRGHELQLCLTGPKLLDAHSQKILVCPPTWQESMVACFNSLDHTDLILKSFGYLKLFECISISPITEDRVKMALHNRVHKALKSSTTVEERNLFYLGAGLQWYTKSSRTTNEHVVGLWPLLCGHAHQYGHMLLYLETILISAKRMDCGDIGDEIRPLIDVLIGNLHSALSPLRKLSLHILQELYVYKHSNPAEIIKRALEIESSPLDMASTRSVAVHIRKLSSLYEAISTHEWIPKAIAHFCFGLLSYKLSSANSDAIIALKQICETKVGEEIVSEICFTWLDQREPVTTKKTSRNVHQAQGQRLTDFQCSNLKRVETLIGDNSKQVDEAAEFLQREFDTTHMLHSRQVDSAASLALRVLTGIPHIAEKRSRRLVPLFLAWAAEEETEMPDAAVNDEETSSETIDQDMSAQTWGYKDRKAMLTLFGSFNNPTVLYQSLEVFKALQELLSKGDVEIQKSALKALLTWKIRDLQPYQEHLFNLLDEARFRDEISTFLQVDVQDSIIEPDHRRVLMPIMLRLLYGKMVARSGSKSGKAGQTVKRKAVLQALSRLDHVYLSMFVQIALGPLKDVELLEGSQLNDQVVAEEILSTRKQAGLINMLKDMLSVLGSKLAPVTSNLINALLYCLVRASRQLHTVNEFSEEASTGNQQTSLLKTIRQTGLQCLILLFRSSPFQQLQPYIRTVFIEIVIPRLNRLAIDTAQSVSGTLQLLSALASTHVTVISLVEYDQRALSAVVGCLEVPSAKDEVKLFVLDDILKRIVNLTSPSASEPSSRGAQDAAQKVLRPTMDLILERVGALLRKSPGKELLASAIELVSMLAPLVEGSLQSESLLEISTFLLDQPSQRVSPKSKGDLLQIIKHFLPLVGPGLSATVLDHVYRTTSSLFGYFKDRANRLILSEVMTELSAKDAELQRIAQLCISLNSFSAKRLDEPDFDQRMKAFGVINEESFREFSTRQWRPLLYNMLYYIKDNEELAIRTNASFALRRFVETNVVDAEDVASESSNLVKTVLLPALRAGVSESSELVRTEYLGVMAHLVQTNMSWVEVNDMRPLLVEADEEASFFSNVLHIQQHRRLRALRRLAAKAQEGGLRSANVAHFFTPLVEHFVFDKADDESAHNLSAEAVRTLGALASSLEWPQFRALFRRYSGYIQSKPDVEKTVIKLLGVAIDALTQAFEDKKGGSEPPNGTEIATNDSSAAMKVQTTLAMTMPGQEKLADDLSNNLLPSLTKYLHEKDEATVSLRVPVAVSVVKLLKLLPPERFRERLPAVLTDVCNILRSRAQESRDLTRKTLTEVSTLIGPEYFGFVLKELRSALARGYQLHVLSFTVHSILVATADIFKPGDLNYCLNQIVAVIMDDIFGATGQEKDAEEYISKMKEVKSSRSYDSMELVAKTATVDNLVHLVRPLQALLEEKLDLRLVRKIDELLRRIAAGLLRNGAVQDQRVLVFCHEIIQEVYKTGGTEKTSKKEDYRTKRFLIQSGAKKAGNRGSTSPYHYKLARFALDILRAVLGKYSNLQTPSNLSGFIPIIGDAIVQSNEEVQISALRLLTTIIKVPLKAIDDSAAIYVAECVKIVKSSTSTNIELAQAALKLVSAVLRERRTVDIRETDLAYLLKRLVPDLEEPDKQGVAFGFLKAVMARKIVITEVYEVMDVAAVMMVTNQTKGARDMARGAYFYFIMEYPQSKERFSKQLGFLIKNLDYKHQEGRQSIMEVVHLLLNKVGDDLAQDIVSTFFVPLVMVVVNDESKQCREMAGALLKEAFRRADAERMQSFLTLLRAWIAQLDQPVLVRVALQAYGIYLEVKGADAQKGIPQLEIRLAQILKSNLKDTDTADWEILYFALETFAKMRTISPTSAFASTTAPVWASVRQSLTFPHAWIKLSSAKLLESYFDDFASTNAKSEGKIELPLKGSGGLLLIEQEIVEITRASLALLKVPAVSEELAAQSVRNLVFLGRIMAQTSMRWPKYQSRAQLAQEPESESDEEENEPVEMSQFAKPAINYLVNSTARILRQPPTTTRAASLTPHHSTLTLLATLASTVDLALLSPTLPAILRPVHNLTDPTIPAPFSTDTAFVEGYKSLQTKSHELMGMLQKRLGTTEYAKVMQGVRDEVKGRREERRGKRRVEMVADPERAGMKRQRKGERKRDSRKRRGDEMGRMRRGL